MISDILISDILISDILISDILVSYKKKIIITSTMSAPVFGTCSAKAGPPSAPFSFFSLGLLDPRTQASGPSEQPTGSASGHAEQPTGSASGPAEPACGGSELAGGGSEPAGDGSGALRHVDVSTQTNLDASTQYPEPAGDGSGAETEARDREQSLPEAAPGEAAPVEENDFHVDIDERGHREHHITSDMVPVNNTLYWDSRTNRWYNSQGVWVDSLGRLMPHSGSEWNRSNR